MRRVVGIFEKASGPEHPDAAVALNNLAVLLNATNRVAEAEPLMQRALAIDEKSYGPDHPDVARDLNNLAQLLQATNRLEEAEPLMTRMLAINEKVYSPESPAVAPDLDSLAQLLLAMNRPEEAEPLMRRQMEIFLRYTLVTLEEHPRLHAATLDYVGLLQQMRSSEEQARARAQEIAAEYGIS